jgi:Pectate lyase superfamily protein
MPNKSVPQLGDSNWGTPLNAHLAQLQNPNNGGINTFEQFSGRPTNLTTDDAGKTYLYTQTGNLHQWTGTSWKVLNESVINVKDYGAIGDGVADDTAVVQSCIDREYLSIPNVKFADQGRIIYFPAGVYRITSTINCSTSSQLNEYRWGINILFQKKSSLTEYGARIFGETGTKPVIETTGNDGVVLENVAIVSGSNNASHIGILQTRPSFPNSSAFRHKYINLFIRLSSDPTANGGLGTIGLINVSAEECTYVFTEIWANTPCVVSDTYKLRFTNKTFDGQSNFDIVSAFGIDIVDSFSTSQIVFSEATRFYSYDYISPIVLIHTSPINENYGEAFSQIGNIQFANLFMIKALPSGRGLGPNAGNGSTALGAYDYAIECYNCHNLLVHGNFEGCGRFMLLKGNLEQANLNVACDGNSSGNIFHPNDPFLLLKCNENQHKISNSKISLYTGTSVSPLIGWAKRDPNFTNEVLSYDLVNSVFTFTRKYNSNSIQKGIFKQTVNSTFGYFDKQIKIGENSLTTKVKKSIGDKNLGKNLIKIEMPSIVNGQNSFAGTCRIEGVLTNSNKTNAETATANFVSTFSFSTNANTLSVTVSPAVTTISSSISTNVSAINITGLNITTPIVNFKPDAFQIKVDVAPVTTGTLVEEIFLTGKVEIFYSDTAKDNIVIDF